MRRHSFLVQIHPGEVSTLENLRTRERVRLDNLTAVGSQIERWLSEGLVGRSAAGGSGDRRADSGAGRSHGPAQG